jgi:hypothetical protein
MRAAPQDARERQGRMTALACLTVVGQGAMVDVLGVEAATLVPGGTTQVAANPGKDLRRDGTPTRSTHGTSPFAVCPGCRVFPSFVAGSGLIRCRYITFAYQQ